MRFLLIAVLFSLIFWVARGLNRPGRKGASGNSGIEELVQDALTGVYFAKNEAVTVIRGGETLYFSSLENRDQYLAKRR